MGENKITFTGIIYLLFIIGTIVTLLIVFGSIDNSISAYFLGGYAFFAVIIVLYTIFGTILNLRKLKWVEIRKRLLKFIIYFILFGVINFIFDYFFRPTNIDLFREFSTPFGFALAVSFYDIIAFSKKKDAK
jgi:amino acid transporter